MGCATQYGPRGMGGGYSDRPLDPTSYLVRYDAAPMIGIATTPEQLAPLWERRAKELCGSEDYFKETEFKRFDIKSQQESPIGDLAAVGVVYCNNKFLDTRRQTPDDNFQQFTNLPSEVFAYKEITPLWNLLVNQQYKELQEETQKLITGLNEEETIELLSTFSRTTPVAEAYFSGWIDAYPNSYLAYYARAEYYWSVAWSKRGSDYAAKLTQEQREDFKKYSEMSVNDSSHSISLKPGFCPAHSKKLLANIGLTDKSTHSHQAIFETAKSACPDSFSVHRAYLRYLLPRWFGSKEQMRTFIDDTIKSNPKMGALETIYITEEGDQLLFSNNFDGAIEKYSKALSIAEFSFIYQQRAVALENAKRYVESLEDYDIAIKMSPYFERAYEGAARVLAKQNNILGATIALSTLTALDNQNAYLFEIQGDLFYAMRRYEDALASYEMAAIVSNGKAVHKHKIRMTKFQIDVRQTKQNETPRRTTI